MGKLLSAGAAALIPFIDEAINAIPDPLLRLRLKSLTYAVKVPYAFLKEILPSETDKFILDILTNKNITKEVIESPEFQQALGKTLNSMVYIKEKEKRDIVKRAFEGAFINSYEYAKNELDRLQDVAGRISIPALQHLGFLKREILPTRNKEVEEKYMKHVNKYSPFKLKNMEQLDKLKRNTPITEFYDKWHKKQSDEVRRAYDSDGQIDSKTDYDLSGVVEDRNRMRFREFWTEFNTLGIFQQGNDPSTGELGGGGGTVQCLTQFGEYFISFVDSFVKKED